MRNGCNYFKNAIIIGKRIGRSLFVRRIKISRSMSTKRKGVTKLWISF